MTTNNAINVGTGTAGEVLTSNGPGVAPTFQAAAGGGGATFPQPGIDETGAIYYLGWPRSVSTGAGATDDDRLILTPMVIEKNVTVTGLIVKTNAGSGSAICRLGIYQLDESNAEFDLVADTGTIDCSSAGIKIGAISQALTAGTPYWMCLVGDKKGGTTTYVNNQYPLYIGFTSNFNVIQYYYKDGVDCDSALPNTVTIASCTAASSGSDPIILFKTS